MLTEKRGEEPGATLIPPRKCMKPPPPASAFSGSVGKNAMQKVESVNLQPLELLLLELLLETRRRAGRIAGERQFDEDARDHA